MSDVGNYVLLIIWPAGSCSQAVLLTLSSYFPFSFIVHDLGTVQSPLHQAPHAKDWPHPAE